MAISSSYYHCLAGFYFAYRRRRKTAEKSFKRALVGASSVHLRALLYLRLAISARRRKATLREIHCLETTLRECANRNTVLSRKLAGSALEQFRSITGSDQGRDLAGFCVRLEHASKARVTVLGTSTSTMGPSTVSIFIDDRKIAGVPVQRVDAFSLPSPGSYFTFKLSRDLIEGLDARTDVVLEIGGARYPLPEELYGSFERGVHTDEAPSVQFAARGYLLDAKGLLSPPRDRNEEWLSHTFGHYARARTWFKDRLGHDLYLVGGTLLGFARSGQVIAFDKDFDTGYVSRHTDPNLIREEFRDIILALLKEGEDIRLLTAKPRVRRDYFMWHSKSGEHIDIFPGALVDGHYRRPTFVNVPLTREDFLPLRSERFNGVEVMVPKNMERKVAAVYGPGWRHPDPFWRKVKSPDTIAYRKTIMLTDDDLRAIAQVSRREGALLQQLLETGKLKTQH